MKVAVSSANGKTICGHAGKCPGYLVFEMQGDQKITQLHVKLSRNQILKHFHGLLSQSSDHPLFGINALITKSLGEGLRGRLLRDGIKVIDTVLVHPMIAINNICIIE